MFKIPKQLTHTTYACATLTGGRPQPWWCRNNRNGGGQNRSPISIKHSADSIRRPTSNSGVWTWLGGSRRSSAGPDQIGPPSTSPAENHYTHMDDAYSPVGVSEALYAELDRESVRSANPSYQNTAYSQCGEVSARSLKISASVPAHCFYIPLVHRNTISRHTSKTFPWSSRQRRAVPTTRICPSPPCRAAPVAAIRAPMRLLA